MGVTGGIISVIARYTPVEVILGDYRADLSISISEPTTLAFSSSTEFSILGPLSAQAGDTMYPITEDGRGLGGDLAIIQVDFGGTLTKDISSVELFGELVGGGEPLTVLEHDTLSMIAVDKVHEALRLKWDISEEMDFLLPLPIPLDASAGAFRPSLRAVDRAGQIVELTGVGVAPRVDVATSRDSFNIYLMPDFTYVGPPLECVEDETPALCSGDGAQVEFAIEQLLAQTVSWAKLNPAFLVLKGLPATADVPLSEVVEKVTFYDQGLGDFRRYNTGPAFSDLFRMGPGRGFIVTSQRVGGVSPFLEVNDLDIPQLRDDEVPVPIKLTFRGDVIADPLALPPGTRVEPNWSLVSAHTERDTTVGRFLAPVSLPEPPGRQWVQLVSFMSHVEVKLDGDRVVLRAGGIPEVDWVEGRFESLRGPGSPEFGPEPSGDVVRAGAGLWLFMCETPTATCVGGDLLPVLE